MTLIYSCSFQRIESRRSYRLNKTPEDDKNMDFSSEHEDYSTTRRSRPKNDHLNSTADSVERLLVTEKKTVSYSYHRSSKNSSRINQSDRSDGAFSDEENEWNGDDSSRQNHSSFLNNSFDRASNKENASFSYDARKLPKKRTEEAPAKNDYVVMVLVVLGVIFGGYAIFVNLKPRMIAHKQHCVEFDELAKQFTHQDPKLWKSLRKGVEGVLNDEPQRPSIFLLAYNDLSTSEQLMENILNATATCMQSSNPIRLDGNSVVGNHGDLIAKYKDQCKSSGIMYISNIDRITMPAAQMFHVFCDTIEPLVERAVIFLTIHIQQYERNIRPNQLSRLIETDLERYWHDTDANTLEALIARVTDQVFLLHPEQRLH